ncbi:hypothetical protein [Salinicoccus roseus]|uniref:hypothetical protein n=1 Tax=Salinicoccus roseus TaxID=45670 RepID=UPI002FE16939
MIIDVIPKGTGSKAHNMSPSSRMDKALPAGQPTSGVTAVYINDARNTMVAIDNMTFCRVMTESVKDL